MSQIIIEDNARLWTLYSQGEIVWRGTVTDIKDMSVVGPVDLVEADAVTIYSGPPVTGFHYKGGTVTTFPGFDSLETATTAFYFLAGMLMTFWLLKVVVRMVTHKHTDIS